MKFFRKQMMGYEISSYISNGVQNFLSLSLTCFLMKEGIEFVYDLKRGYMISKKNLTYFHSGTDFGLFFAAASSACGYILKLLRTSESFACGIEIEITADFCLSRLRIYIVITTDFCLIRLRMYIEMTADFCCLFIIIFG